jgi:hypothetical protein
MVMALKEIQAYLEDSRKVEKVAPRSEVLSAKSQAAIYKTHLVSVLNIVTAHCEELSEAEEAVLMRAWGAVHDGYA